MFDRASGPSKELIELRICLRVEATIDLKSAAHTFHWNRRDPLSVHHQRAASLSAL
jgi:hypothetical protein